MVARSCGCGAPSGRVPVWERASEFETERREPGEAEGKPSDTMSSAIVGLRSLSASIGVFVCLAACLLAGKPANAAPVVIEDLSRSPDVPVELTTGGGTFGLAADVVGSSSGPVAIGLEELGTLPNGLDVTAFHYAPGADALFAIDAPASLGGTLFLPGDVVRYDALADIYTLRFDGTDEAIDPAVVDALSTIAGDLLLSFDTPVVLEGVTLEPGDLVQWSPGVASLVFDASAEGVPSSLNLDAAHYLPDGHLLLSFDSSGNLGGVDFDDEDIVEFDPGGPSYQLAVDGSVEDSEWRLANVDAIHVGPELSIFLR